MSEPTFKRARLNKAELFKLCRYSPHAGQQLIHDASARFKIIACGVRFGKTHAGAHEMLAAALAPHNFDGWTGWAVAPLHSLADISFRAICSIVSNHLPEHIVSLRETDGELVLLNLAGKQSRILRRTTERGKVALTGSSVDFMLIDEASAVPDDIWESSLSTRLVDRLGEVCAISTPRGISGWWADMLRDGLRGENSEVFALQLPSWANPRLSKDELKKIRRRVPEAVWRQEYCAELVHESGAVFPADAIERCSKVTAWEDPVPGANYVAALDLAMSSDRTVLVVGRLLDSGGCRVAVVKSWKRLPWEQQVSEVERIVNRYYEAQLRVDESGLGKPVVQSMRGSGKFLGGVRGEVWTPAAKHAMVRNLGVILERGRIALPTRELCPMMYDELLAFSWLDDNEAGVNGMRRCGAPKNANDDHVAALMMLALFFRGGSSGSCQLGGPAVDREPGMWNHRVGSSVGLRLGGTGRHARPFDAN